MKSICFLPLVLLLLCTGCDPAPAQEITYGDHEVYQAYRIKYPTNSQSTSKEQTKGDTHAGKSVKNPGNNLVMHAIPDAKTGLPVWYDPFPENWKINSRDTTDSISVEGPDGLKIHSLSGPVFAHTSNQELKQMYLKSDIAVRPPMPMDSIFTELLIPQVRPMGLMLRTHYPLPEATANFNAYSRQFSEIKTTHKIDGSDWTDDAGNKVFIVLIYAEQKHEGGMSWGYYLEMLQANPSHFEQAKQAYMYGISHKRFNRHGIDAYNEEWARQENTRDYVRIYTGDFYRDSTGKMVQDIPRHLGRDYFIENKPKSFGSNRTPTQIRNDSVNVIPVINPFNKVEYVVASGFEIYWINEKGQYISSEDTLFNPNSFEAQPGMWQKATVKTPAKLIFSD